MKDAKDGMDCQRFQKISKANPYTAVTPVSRKVKKYFILLSSSKEEHSTAVRPILYFDGGILTKDF